MTLQKRYFRSIRSNLSFYVSATVLTVLTLFMFYLMNIAGNAILDFADDFYAEKKLEDAQFTTYLPLSEENIRELEAKYHLELEAQEYFNIDTDGICARVFSRNEKINFYEVTEGRDTAADDEIIISEGFAVYNKVALGDTIKVGEKSYRITGFFQRPDYLYMLERQEDSYKNITTFFLAYVTDAEFERLGTPDITYFVRYQESDINAFRKEINENFIMRSYLSAQENNRIKMVVWQAKIFVAMSYVLLCVMPLVTVVLISIIIGRKVKSEQKIIGTLTALGYTKGKLLFHYVGFAVLPGIIGGILSVLMGIVFAQPYGEAGLQDYEPLRINCHLGVLPAILGILVPTIFYALAAMRTVKKLLRKDAVLLLSGTSAAAENKRKKILAGKKTLFGKKLSFRTKFAVRSMVGNPGRCFAVFMGIFMGSYIVMLGLACVDTIQEYMDKGMEGVGSYRYEYIFNCLKQEPIDGAEGVLLTSLESEDGKSIAVIGTTNDNRYLDLKTETGEKVTLSDDYYLTTVSAEILDVSAGDTIAMYNPLTLEKYEFKIAGIIDQKMQSAIFTERENACRLAGIPEGSYNAVMSDKKLNLSPDEVLQTIEMEDFSVQFKQMLDQMGIIIYVVLAMGIIICVASVYVAVNMLVVENRSNISMLKVLGYEEKKINPIVLRVNHVFLPLGILVCIPVVIVSVNAFLSICTDLMGMIIVASVYPRTYVIVVALTSACYFGSLYLVSRKVKKVDMIESLKDNRE